MDVPRPEDVFNIIAEPENKLTIMTTKQYTIFLEKMRFLRGKASFKFVEEGMRSLFITFTMETGSPYFEQTKDVTMRLVEAGICPFFLGGSVTNVNPERIEETVPPLVLTLEELEVGFLVCIIPLTFSVLAFFCEIMVPRIVAVAIKTRDLIAFLFVVQAFAGINRVQT